MDITSTFTASKSIRLTFTLIHPYVYTFYYCMGSWYTGSSYCIVKYTACICVPHLYTCASSCPTDETRWLWNVHVRANVLYISWENFRDCIHFFVLGEFAGILVERCDCGNTFFLGVFLLYGIFMLILVWYSIWRKCYSVNLDR